MIFNNVSDDVKNIIMALKYSDEPELNGFACLLDSLQIKRQINKSKTLVYMVGKERSSDSKEGYPSFG